jgi:hypothetical protein
LRKIYPEIVQLSANLEDFNGKKQITKKLQEIANKKIEELVKIVPEPDEINPKKFYDLEGDIFSKGFCRQGAEARSHPLHRPEPRPWNKGPQSSCKRFWHYPVIIISLYGCIPDSGQCGPVPAAHKADFYPHFIKKNRGCRGNLY